MGEQRVRRERSGEKKKKNKKAYLIAATLSLCFINAPFSNENLQECIAKYTCLHRKPSNTAKMRNMFRKRCFYKYQPDLHLSGKENWKHDFLFNSGIFFSLSNPFFMSQLQCHYHVHHVTETKLLFFFCYTVI